MLCLTAACNFAVPCQEYLQDLAELPENPWALKGLTQVYAAQGPKAAGKLEEVRPAGFGMHAVACYTRWLA